MSEECLPDEVLIYIFSGIGENALGACKLVCHRWYEIASDQHLIYYFQAKDPHISRIMIDSCERGNPISFQISVDNYVCVPEFGRLMRRYGETHDLWVKCMIASSRGGHPQILNKVLSYGPTYGFSEAIAQAKIHGHTRCVEILEREGIKV
jgi:hypothetical protein